MTRIFTDGAEMQDLLFWNGGTTSVIVDTGFSSPYCYRISTNAVRNFTAITEGYFKARIMHSALSTTAYFAIRSSTTTQSRIMWDASYHWLIQVGTTTVDTSTVFAIPGQWYLMEYYYKIDNSSGSMVLKIDGQEICSYTGDTQPSTPTDFDNIIVARGGTGYYYIDDLALNDTDNSDGKNDNSWCGEGIVLRVNPTSDNEGVAQWLKSSGSVAYELLDDFPADDDTSYIYASGSSTGDQEKIYVSGFDGTGKTITRIWAEGRARETAADGSVIKIGTLASGGADVMSGSIALDYGAYNTVIGPEATVNPVDSQLWEEADINALQIVSEVG